MRTVGTAKTRSKKKAKEAAAVSRKRIQIVLTAAVNSCEHATMRGSGVGGKISSLDGTDDGGVGGGGDGCDEVMANQRDEDKVQDSKSKSDDSDRGDALTLLNRTLPNHTLL